MKESIKNLKKTSPLNPLKVDLHLHTADDPHDRVRHTAKELIAQAAAQRFDVLAITNHHRLTASQDLSLFAKEMGILLIPGIEVSIRRRHVLILNPPPGKSCSDFTSLAKLRRPETLIVAPHPYFPGTHCLNGLLLRHLELFDAIEYCHFYSVGINFNIKAIEVSESKGIPLVGNSDTHFLSQLGTTYSLIHAEKSLEAIFAAIRENRVDVITRPLSPLEMGSILRRFFRMKLRRKRIVKHRWPRPVQKTDFSEFAP